MEDAVFCEVETGEGGLLYVHPNLGGVRRGEEEYQKKDPGDHGHHNEQCANATAGEAPHDEKIATKVNSELRGEMQGK